MNGSPSEPADSVRQRIAVYSARIRRFPCKLFVLLVVVSLAVGEWYPLSPFPMYATLGARTSFVYITDGADQPLATKVHFGKGAISLRKVFLTQGRILHESDPSIRPGKVDRMAARQLLELIVRERKPKPHAGPLPDRLRLWRTFITTRDDRLERRQDLLAEIAVR